MCGSTMSHALHPFSGGRSRSIFALGLIAFVLPLAGAALHAAIADAQTVPDVVISEFMAANDNTIVDNTGQFEDWIELHNTSASAIDLGGWTITDNSESYVFDPGFTIAPAEYLVIFASGAPLRSTAGELHLPFKLSAGSDSLTLLDAASQLSQPAWPPPVGYPPQLSDVSYGVASGGQIRFFTSPTPGAANGGGVNGLVDRVSFSVPHGFYTPSQTVVLNTTTPSATIRYTLDGSTPTSTNGTAISPGSSITVASTSTVRAIAYRSGWIDSGVETRTYLFAADVVTQPSSTQSGWPDDREISNQHMDYGMDPSVVSGSETTVTNSLTSIPSISIVTDLPNLFDNSTGIYTNAGLRGAEWERPASIELIDPTGAETGFDINGGIRIRGGFSRSDDNPKHSLRLFFRDDYGDGDLDYALFGAEGVDRFAKVDLRTSQNYGWQWRRTQGADATYLEELWSRDTQAAMGQPYTRTRHYHLYLNGQYWGLYMTQERVSGEFGESYFGGTEDDYDVVKRAAPARTNEATSGTDVAWRSLWPLVDDLNVTTAEFSQLEAQVDLVNLADYYLLHFFSGDFDGSPSWYFQAGGFRWTGSNNWYAARNRTGVGPAGKWLFFDHDSEHSLCAASGPMLDEEIDNTPPWNLDGGGLVGPEYMTPSWLHESLITHPAYRRIFADRVALHMISPGGALTADASQARFDARVATMSGAIDAESARWGDSAGEPPYDRNTWNAALTLKDQCFAARPAIVQQQLQADGLWPLGDPPTMTPPGGAVPWGTSVSLDAGGQPGTIRVTTDGSDPSEPDGTVSPSAFIYSAPIAITAETTVKARLLDGPSWSPLTEQSYVLSTPPGPVPLALNEFNAVGSANFLGGGLAGDAGNGSDATLGRILGNGGDWLELVVIEDGLDLRGWQIQIWNNTGVVVENTATLVIGPSTELSDLAAGSLITISEDIADDVSYNPPYGDWHINLQSNDLLDGGFITPASQTNFAINNDDTQIAILDETGQVVALRTGEGTVPGVAVNSTEVFKLEATPTSAIGPTSLDYQDGTSSTWGLPNQWAGGLALQDLSDLREFFGDVNCDGLINIGDPLVILQHTVGSRAAVSTCPLPDPAGEIYAPAGDINSDDLVSIGDALLLLQCLVAIPNAFCP